MRDISRRQCLQRLGMAAAALSAPLGRSHAAELVLPPNIVLVLADDLGYGDLGCYGGPWPTPNIDQLARDGLRFTDYHANAPVCSPTRTALLTGRYQQRAGVDGVFTAKRHRENGLGLEEITLAEVFKSRGYATGLSGKWHLGYPAALGPTKHGFDSFEGFVSGNVDYVSHVDQEGMPDWWRDAALAPAEGYSTDLITAAAERFIENHQKEPFLAVIAHAAVHYPYQAPNDAALRTLGKPAGAAHGPEDSAVYGAMLAALDESVGRLQSALNRLNLAQNTLFMFVSDNGATGPGRNAPLRDKKGTLYEGGHRVPGIACWPGRISPGVCGETVMGMDLFPTLASLAGATLPERGVDGVDLTGLLFERHALPARDVFWGYGKSRAMRRGPWKLLLARGSEDPEPHLYELDSDLEESKNLAGEHPERAAEMRAAVAAWEAEVMLGVTMKT